MKRTDLLVLFLLLVKLCVIRGVPLSAFYPFGPSAGDAAVHPNDDSYVGPVSIPFNLPFFNNVHNSLWVNNNGVVSFLQGIWQYTSDAFPLSTRLLTAYWADVDTRGTSASDHTRDKVYYRWTSDSTLLERASTDIRQFFFQRYFQPRFLYIVTWYRVGYYSVHTDKLNTFQAVIMTDQIQCFVFFLYEDGGIQWTTGDASGGSGGFGGVPAQVGFNAGDGVNFFSVPGSRTAEIINLASTSNFGVPGKWGFRIDLSEIASAGCGQGLVDMYPHFGSELGGESITFVGPCFAADQTLKCRFNGNLEIPAQYVDTYTSTCVAPPAYNMGPSFFEVWNPTLNQWQGANSQWTYKEQTDYAQTVTFQGQTPLSPGSAQQILWTPINGVSTVDVNLYSWSRTEGFVVLQTLATGAPNSGSFNLVLPSPDLLLHRAFVIRVESPIAALSTYSFMMVPTSGDAAVLCTNWAASQPEPDVWRRTAPTCPCDSTQASKNPAYEPDVNCPLGNGNSVGCGRRIGSTIGCVRPKFSSYRGYGQLCCFANDGTLITSGSDAGYFQLQHPLAIPPPGIVGPTTTAGNLYHDRAPEAYCCQFSDNCDTFYTKRPRASCLHYAAPRSSVAFGDPHLITLDGKDYTFNGAGEYTFLYSAGVSIQVRFEKVSAPGGSPTATSLTALGIATLSGSTTLEYLYGTFYMTQNALPFDFFESTKQNFGDQIVVYDAPTKTITMDFSDGARIIVVGVTSSHLVLQVFVPQSYRGLTGGLLGIFNGDMQDDFASFDGSTLPIDATTEEIHQNFGEGWRVDSEGSIFQFQYLANRNWNYFNDLTFVPTYVAPPPSAESITACTTLPVGWFKTACQWDVTLLADSTLGAVAQKAYDMHTYAEQNGPPDFYRIRDVRIFFNYGTNVTADLRHIDYEGDSITFEILEQPAGAGISANYLWFWQGTETSHVTARATDSRGAATTVRIDFILTNPTTGTTQSTGTTGTTRRTTGTTGTTRTTGTTKTTGTTGVPTESATTGRGEEVPTGESTTDQQSTGGQTTTGNGGLSTTGNGGLSTTGNEASTTGQSSSGTSEVSDASGQAIVTFNIIVFIFSFISLLL